MPEYIDPLRATLRPADVSGLSRFEVVCLISLEVTRLLFHAKLFDPGLH